MIKLFKKVVFLILIPLIFMAVCDDSKGAEDTHYKPAEYKHNEL